MNALIRQTSKEEMILLSSSAKTTTGRAFGAPFSRSKSFLIRLKEAERAHACPKYEEMQLGCGSADWTNPLFLSTFGGTQAFCSRVRGIRGPLL